MNRDIDKLKRGRVVFYTIVSFFFGSLFPVLVTIARILKFELTLSINNFIETQMTTPSLWVIDFIPLVTSYLVFVVLKRQSQLRILANQLEAEIVESASEMSIQRNYFESLYENIPAPVVTLGKSQSIQTCNPAFERLFGFKKEEILNKKLDPLISDANNLQEAEKITRRVLSGKSVEDIGIRKRKDNTLIEVEIKSVPIMINGQQVGSLAIYNDVTEKNKLERALKSSMKDLEVMALRDSLTGLLNRRAITEYASGELDRAMRENSGICFALVDMDNLKEINDSYGHLMGDEALKSISAAIKKSCRTYDKVGRWGGDEFLIIFSQNNQEEGLRFSERIRKEINNNLLSVSRIKKIQINVCIGVVCYSAKNGENITVEQLLHQADEALYKAKQSGRNQVCLYS